jgi:hypothetical protein
MYVVWSKLLVKRHSMNCQKSFRDLVAHWPVEDCRTTDCRIRTQKSGKWQKRSGMIGPFRGQE